MPRRRRRRRVRSKPDFEYFSPRGGGPSSEVILKVEEFEAIRLKDHKDLTQEEAAKEMNVSQPTFHRILVSARKKIADAITNGKGIRIEGGDYEMTNSSKTSS